MSRRHLLWIHRNWKRLCVSILLAPFLWYALFIQSNQELVLSLRPKIDAHHIPQDFEVTKRSEESVRLYFQGSRSQLTRINPSFIQPSIDIQAANFHKIGPGTHPFPVRVKNEKLPIGTALVRYEPESISLTVEQVIEVPVKIQYRIEINNLPKAWTLEIKPQKTYTKVRGRSRDIENVNDGIPTNLIAHEFSALKKTMNKNKIHLKAYAQPQFSTYRVTTTDLNQTYPVTITVHKKKPSPQTPKSTINKTQCPKRLHYNGIVLSISPKTYRYWRIVPVSSSLTLPDIVIMAQDCETIKNIAKQCPLDNHGISFEGKIPDKQQIDNPGQHMMELSLIQNQSCSLEHIKHLTGVFVTGIQRTWRVAFREWQNDQSHTNEDLKDIPTNTPQLRYDDSLLPIHQTTKMRNKKNTPKSLTNDKN